MMRLQLPSEKQKPQTSLGFRAQYPKHLGVFAESNTF